MKRSCVILLCGGGPLLWSAVAMSVPATGGTRWQWELAGGFDATVHTYALAVDDTTETIAEFMMQAALEGRSNRQGKHRWRLRGDASAGTELWRQRLDGDYRLVDSEGLTRLRLDGRVAGRQYRQDTDYQYSSDNWEGRLTARVQPVAWRSVLLELKGWGAWQDYRTPSTLELDARQLAAGAYLRSREVSAGYWSAGLSALHRAYPDSSEIDRDQLAAEVDFESGGLDEAGLRLHHRSEQRTIADETVRPSAWAHWTDVVGTMPAGGGSVVGELQSEIWSYDYETEVWFDSWRLEGLLGYRWGDIMALNWLVGLSGERLDAGDNPDSYGQWGLRGGVESYGPALSGSLTVEFGRRMYRDSSIELTDGGTTSETFALYSDFDYWKIWLVGSWQLADDVALEAIVSYEPESHTEQADDSALGFANLRLVWRP